MTSNKPRAAFVALLLAGVLAHGVARADAPTPADLESARALVKEGRALRANGDLRGALEKFRAGHALGQTPITALELARTHEMLGDLVEAREVCLSVARMPIEGDETERSAVARQEAEKLAQALAPRIPSLVVQVAGLAPGAVPAVRIDGLLLPPEAYGATLKANPRAHDVAVSLEGYETAHADVQLAEGETKTVLVPLVRMKAEVAPAPAPAPRPLVTAGIVVGTAGGVVGITAALLAMSKRSKLDDQCVDYKCAPGEPGDTLAAARQWGTVSTVAFGVAVVGAGMLVVGLVTGPKAKSAAISPWIGVGSAGVRGAF